MSMNRIGVQTLLSDTGSLDPITVKNEIKVWYSLKTNETSFTIISFWVFGKTPGLILRGTQEVPLIKVKNRNILFLDRPPDLPMISQQWEGNVEQRGSPTVFKQRKTQKGRLNSHF